MLPLKDATNLVLAHKHCVFHRDEVLASERCGCFYCFAIFSPTEILTWTDEDQTAFCPTCDIDAVLGSASGYPISAGFLRIMHERWFSTS